RSCFYPWERLPAEPFLPRVGGGRYAQIQAHAKASAPKSGWVTSAPATSLVHSFIGQQNSNATCPPIGCNPPDQGLAASPRWVFEGSILLRYLYPHVGGHRHGCAELCCDAGQHIGHRLGMGRRADGDTDVARKIRRAEVAQQDAAGLHTGTQLRE